MSKIDKLKFDTLNHTGRKLLLTALEIDINDLSCHYCKEKVDYKNCGIMPALNKDKLATILCTSVLCMATYLEDYEG